MSHVLIILDCCYAANAARDTAEGTTKELLAACSRENRTLGVGQRSFTSALIDELRAFEHVPFTVSMLHGRLVTMRWKLAYTPFYANLSEHRRTSIELAPLPMGDKSNVEDSASVEESSSAYEPMDTSFHDETTTLSSTQPSSQSSPSSNSGTRVLLAVSVSQEADLDIDQWISWLTTQAPWDVTAVDVQVEGIYRSHSTLVLASVPTPVWDRLPARAAYQFVGFIKSGNLLLRNSLHKSTNANISPDWGLGVPETPLRPKVVTSGNISRSIRPRSPSRTYNLRSRVACANARESSSLQEKGTWSDSIGKGSAGPRTNESAKNIPLRQIRQSSRNAPISLAPRISLNESQTANLTGGLSRSPQEAPTLLDSHENIRDSQLGRPPRTESLLPKDLPEYSHEGLAGATPQVEKNRDVGEDAARRFPSTTSQGLIRVPSSRTAPYPPIRSSGNHSLESVSSARNESNKNWSPEEDGTLLHARRQGLNWAPIAELYFPSKTPNACRKRHERIVLKNTVVGDWDAAKAEALAQCYTELREEMWRILATKVNEKWEIVEAKVTYFIIGQVNIEFLMKAVIVHGKGP